MMSTDPFSVVVAVIVGLMLTIPVSLLVRAWSQGSSPRRRRRNDDAYYCNGVAVSPDDVDSRV